MECNKSAFVLSNAALKLIAFLVLLILAAIFLSGCGKPTLITADQMVYAQINMGQNMYPIVDSMADSYSEYLAFNKSESEFIKDIESLKQQYNDLEKSYKEFNKKYKLESSDEKLLQAIKCMENARHAVGDILNGSIVDGKVISRSDLLQLYVKQGTVIQNNLENFKKIITELYESQSKKEN